MKPSATHPSRVVVGVVTCAITFALAREASAQSARTARLDYDAIAGCSDQASFEGQVLARSAKVSFVADATTALRVRITGHGGRFEGEVALVEPRGRESRRHVEGSCEDVTAALALIAALALDPGASTATDPHAGSPTPTPTPSPTSASTPPPPPPPPPSKPRDASATSDSAPLSDDDARAHPWGWSVGAEAAVTQGVAPSALVSIPAFLDVWSRSTRAFAPAFRARFERGESGTGSAEGGDFTWTAGSLDACPFAASAGRLRAWPCVRAEGGSLAATGTNVSPALSDSRPWFTVGLVARARLTILGSLFFELEGGAFAPLVRDRFYVAPDATVQRAPVVAAAGAAGAGVTFW